MDEIPARTSFQDTVFKKLNLFFFQVFYSYISEVAFCRDTQFNKNSRSREIEFPVYPDDKNPNFGEKSRNPEF